jgi:thiamine-monophosphate kinase
MIRGVWRRLGVRAAPSGDDCAFIEIDGVRLALSSDLSIEDTHFRTGWMRHDETGWRAATAALSDLAAVAAEPLGVLVSVGTSPEYPNDHLAEVMEGVAAAVEEAGAVIWGGDVVRSDRLMLDVMVIGRLEDEPVRRSGAQVGDGLFVTGRLGGPASALQSWQEGREPDAAARERFVRPHARIREARWLRDREGGAGAGAHAMIDLSDGLLPDAAHLAAASDVACVLDVDAVPLHPTCTDSRAALVSGEEYELLVALPDDGAVAGEFSGHFGLSLTRVGRIEAGSGVRLEQSGEVAQPPDGFTHF